MTPDNTVSDKHVVRKVLAGQANDFSILVRRYLPAMEALAYSATGSHADAQDIAQESFLRAFQHLNRLEAPERFGAWLATIVRNTSRTFLSRRAKRAGALTALPRKTAAAPPVEQRELHAFLRREVGRLDQTYRDVLLLHYFAGMTAREIAGVLAISRSAVLKRLERGRQALGQQLVEAFGQGLPSRERELPEKVTRIMGLAAACRAPWTPGAASNATAAGGHAALRAIRAANAGLRWATLAGGALAIAGLALFAGSGVLTASPIDEVPTASAVAEQAADLSPVPDSEPFTGGKDESIDGEEAVASEPSVVAEQEPDVRTVSPASVVAALPGYPGTDVAGALCHTVSGVVYDPRGKPLPDAKVWGARWGAGAPDTRETVSDEEGRFELRLPEGQWRLLAAKGILGGEADTNTFGEFIVEGEAQTLRTSIFTQERSVLRGQVLAKATGKPIPNATIWTDTKMLVTADAEGRFVVEGLEQEDHTFVAAGPGYMRQYVLCSTALREEAELEVYLKPGGRVTGVVTDEEGRPVAHAWVKMGKSGTGCMDGYFGVCDGQGRFDYDGVPLDREFSLRAFWPCYINACGLSPQPTPAEWRGAVKSSTRKRSLVLALSQGPVVEERKHPNGPSRVCRGVIRGRVLGPNGDPVRSFNIRLRLPRPSSQGDHVEINYDYPGVQFTTADGTFALTSYSNKPGEEVDVVAMVEGYRETRLARVPFKAMAASRPSDAVTLRLREPTTLKVRVLDGCAGGRPVKGARVVFADPFWNAEGRAVMLDDIGAAGARTQYAETDANGLARFPKVVSPDGLVVVEHEGHGTAWARWDGSAASVTVGLEGSCAVEGVVAGEDGGPLVSLSGAHVSLKGTLDGSYEEDDPNDVWRYCSVSPESGGRFRFESLPPRHYRLCVSWALAGNGVTEAVVMEKNYNDAFTLEAGQVLQVAYPRDDLMRDPERLLAQGEVSGTPADAVMREKLVGAWTRTFGLPGSSVIWEVNHFEADGRWQSTVFHSAADFASLRGGRGRRPAYTQAFSGWFTVTGGDIHMYDDVRGDVWLPSVEVRGDTVHIPGNEIAPSSKLTRAESLEAALRDGEYACGVSRDAGLSLVKAAAPRLRKTTGGQSGLGSGGYR